MFEAQERLGRAAGKFDLHTRQGGCWHLDNQHDAIKRVRAALGHMVDDMTTGPERVEQYWQPSTVPRSFAKLDSQTAYPWPGRFNLKLAPPRQVTTGSTSTPSEQEAPVSGSVQGAAPTVQVTVQDRKRGRSTQTASLSVPQLDATASGHGASSPAGNPSLAPSAAAGGPGTDPGGDADEEPPPATRQRTASDGLGGLPEGPGTSKGLTQGQAADSGRAAGTLGVGSPMCTAHTGALFSPLRSSLATALPPAHDVAPSPSALSPSALTALRPGLSVEQSLVSRRQGSRVVMPRVLGGAAGSGPRGGGGGGGPSRRGVPTGPVSSAPTQSLPGFPIRKGQNLKRQRPSPAVVPDDSESSLSSELTAPSATSESSSSSGLSFGD